MEVNFFEMFMWLLGGLALFLYGMEQMVNGLLSVAGEQMKKVLATLTKNRVMGALTGAGVTAVIQSSSVTTVLTVGFVSAGLMSVTQAASVIMGANLGTTITAQIVAFKVTNFALLMIAVGFLIQFASQRHKPKGIGQLIFGLGLIFFGMNVMSEGMHPLRGYEPFLDLMQEMNNPLLAIMVAALFTAAVQSSSATIGVIIVMASNGFITLPAGIALAMGAHIGTTVTAILASIGKSREAFRTALIHTLFNVLAVALWLPFIPELTQWAVTLTAYGSETGVSEDIPRQIANANTLLTFIALVVFIPFISGFVWAVNRIVPQTDDERGNKAFRADYLDVTFIETPSVALDAVMRELQAFQKQQSLFYKRTLTLLEEPKYSKLSKELGNLHKFYEYEKQITAYLGRISQNTLSPEEQQLFLKLLSTIQSLQEMNHTLSHSVYHVIEQMVERNIKPSSTMHNLVGQLTSEVGKAMDKCVHSVTENNNELAHDVIALKPVVNHLIQEALKHQSLNLSPEEQRLLIFRYEMQLVDGFKQLFSLAKRIAHLQINMSQAQMPEEVSAAPKS